MEMVNDLYPKHIPELLEDGCISMELIDQRASEVLRTKFRAGLFEHPYTDPERKKRVLRCPEFLQKNLELAAECMVLAKNDGVLPIRPAERKRIAVVGPLAHERRPHLGTWVLNGVASDSLTLFEAITAQFPECEVVTPDCRMSDLDVKIAQTADVVVCCIGESHENTGETHSICRLKLPPGQEELIEALGQYDTPLVVLCASGRPLPIPAAERHADALLYMWHGGTESTQALAQVIAGERDPGGRFPMTVPRHEGQIPVYYNRKLPGKTVEFGFEPHNYYDDEPFAPLYPFGFGLSYTNFELSDIQSEKEQVRVGEKLVVNCTVSNTGPCAGSTVIQCYLRDPHSEICRPGKELAAFEKVYLAAGESRQVTLVVEATHLGYWLPSGDFQCDPGEIQWGLGFNSLVALDQTIELI